jgi:transcriptional regulator with XRE-family HTH domain
LPGTEAGNASAKMNQYEQGIHIPKFPRLKDLAKALKVPAAYFYAESNELADLLYAYEKLSSRSRQAIARLIK